MKQTKADEQGDTHLWQVWHGLKPFEYFRKRYTRFCSEFGFEALPVLDTIDSFAESNQLDLNS
jgi:beta-mannosidase